MPSLDKLIDKQNGAKARILGMGEAGSHKTGSIVALVNAGYKVRMIDLDGNPEPLFQYIAPDKRHLIDIVHVEDDLQTTDYGLELVGQSKIIPAVKALLTEWKYGSGENAVDLGKPAEWGTDTVLVLDSFSPYSRAALRRAVALEGGLGPRGKTTLRRPTMTAYGTANETGEALLERITSPRIGSHVLVLAHIKMLGPKVSGLPDEDDTTGLNALDDELRKALAREMSMSKTRWVPWAIGRELAPNIAQHFSTVILYETLTSGTPPTTSRVIYTQPREGFQLKVPAPVPASLPADTGLLTILNAVRGVSGSPGQQPLPSPDGVKA